MWRSLCVDDVRITILGITAQFRFMIKCVDGSDIPKVFIFEGGRWSNSDAIELEYYLDFVDEFDAVVRQHQGRGWISTTIRITRLSVLRN